MVFAYAGTPAFFNIASEMRDPHNYTKSLIVCQTVVTVTYVTVGIIVYYFCGSYVSSPALGSAGPLIKRVAYGIALPGLLGTAILLTHVSLPFLFSANLTNRQITYRSQLSTFLFVFCVDPTT